MNELLEDVLNATRMMFMNDEIPDLFSKVAHNWLNKKKISTDRLEEINHTLGLLDLLT